MTALHHPHHLRPIERVRAMVAVVLTGAFFLVFISRFVLAPEDPLGCVSLQSCRLGWLIIPVCLVASAVFSVLATVIGGHRLEGLGEFAVALGLSLASLPYANAAYQWATYGQAVDAARRSTAGWMAIEAIAWLCVIAVAIAASRLVRRWSGIHVARLNDSQEELRNGALTVLFMTIGSILLLQLSFAGTELAPVQTGQVCFACAVSFYLGCLIAYHLTGARSVIWAYFSVGIVAILTYLWTSLSPTPSYPGRLIEELPHYPPTAFGRALPIQMVMIGIAAAAFAFWHQDQLQEPQPAATPNTA